MFGSIGRMETTETTGQHLPANVIERTHTDEIKTYKVYWTVSVVLFTIITIFICVGNALTIVAFCRNRGIRSRANYYIIQMAVADLLLGIFMIQHIIYMIFPELQLNSTNCIIALSNSLLTCTASLSAIVAMNFDRFRSIMWPYSYDSELSFRNYLAATLQIWVPSFILGVIVPVASYNDSHQAIICVYVHTIRREYFMYLLLPHLYCTLIVVLILNIPMFYLANKQINVIGIQQQMVRSNEPNPERNHFKKKLHLLKTVFIIFLTFYGCWLPYTVAISLEAYNDRIFSQTDHPVYFVARYLAFPVILNSGLNPIIYAVRLEVFRNEFWKIFRKVWPSTQVHVGNMTVA